MRLPVLLAFVGLGVLSAQPTDWKIGLAAVDITPGEPRAPAEGGYETRGLYVDYGLFEPAVEQVVLDAVRRMADRAGRSTATAGK